MIAEENRLLNAALSPAHVHHGKGTTHYIQNTKYKKLLLNMQSSIHSQDCLNFIWKI